MIRQMATVAALLIAAAPALAQTATTTQQSTETAATAQPGTAPGQTLADPAIVKEIRDAALAAQKAAAAAAPPPAQKTEEQKQAEAALIARHRDAFMARVEERLAEKPQG